MTHRFFILLIFPKKEKSYFQRSVLFRRQGLFLIFYSVIFRKDGSKVLSFLLRSQFFSVPSKIYPKSR